MKADDPRHGTSAGYIAGCREDCCLTAKRRYDKRRRWELLETGEYRTTPNFRAIRRLRALQAIGWSIPRIAEHCGIHFQHLYMLERHETVYTSTFEKIAATYEALCMVPPVPSTTGERIGVVRARNGAARKGWAPPLAWDDIDDPDEQPKKGRDRSNYLAADLVSEWHHLRASGESIHQAARQLGVTVDAIEKAGERVAQREAS